MSLQCTDGSSNLTRALWQLNFSKPYPEACQYSTVVADSIVALISGADVITQPLLIINFCLDYQIKASAGRKLYSYFKQHCSALPCLLNHMITLGTVLSTSRCINLLEKALTVTPGMIIDHVGMRYLINAIDDGHTDEERAIELINAAELNGTLNTMLDITSRRSIDVQRAVYRKLKRADMSYGDLLEVSTFADRLDTAYQSLISRDNVTDTVTGTQ